MRREAPRSVRWRAWLALGALCAAGPSAGCSSTPTLPLPPPIASVGAPNAQGLVRIEGMANRRAYVTVLNEQTEDGKITRADQQGYFRLEIAAAVGDRLIIWQERDGTPGERSERTVPAMDP